MPKARKLEIINLLKLPICTLVVFLCAPTGSAQQFASVAESLGILHSLESTDGWGGGMSFFDFDNDGLDDLTFILENDSIVLFKNLGGSFEKLPSPVYVQGRTRQAIWVDYDNDGDHDLFITTYGGGSCILLKNTGDFQFVDATFEAGLAGLTTLNYGATFGDYDRDGDLDLYLCRYNMTGVQSDPQDVNALFRNNGDGTFTNVAFDFWVHNGLQPSFMGVWIDVNNDLWPDLYVINDRDNWMNALYINNGDGTFTDAAQQWQATMFDDDPMTATFADFDNDGDLDLYSTNTGHTLTPSRLLVNQSGEFFSEEAAERGVDLNQWGWGASFIDVDNDSNLDLFVATGWTNGFGSSSGEVPSTLYLNQGDHTFAEAPNGYFDASLIAASYGVAIGDIENDGYPDIAVINAKGYNSFLFQNAGGNHHYIKITLEGTVSNRMAIGSWIEVYFGGNKRVHYTRCGENYCGQNSQHHTFGTGVYETVDSVKVRYPSGHTDVHYHLSANQHVTLVEGSSLPKGIEASATFLCPGEETQLTALANSSLTWNTGSTDETITIDQAGDYFYTYTSAFGVTVISDTVSITVEEAPEYSIEYQNPNCNGGGDGQMQLLIADESADFELFVNGLPAGWSLDALEPGNYHIELISPAGCTYDSYIDLVEPELFEVVPSYLPISCYGDSTEVSLFTFGAQQPIVIDWGSTDEGFLPAGDHFVVVTDGNGCSVHVQLELSEPPLMEVLVSAEGPEAFNVQIQGGTPPYTLAVSDPNGEPFDADAVPSVEGYYHFHVSDSEACEVSVAYFYANTFVGSLSKVAPRVFPNPVSKTLRVDAPNHRLSQLQLFDATGRMLQNTALFGASSIALPMSEYAPGFYLLHLQTVDGEGFSHRIIRH